MELVYKRLLTDWIVIVEYFLSLGQANSSVSPLCERVYANSRTSKNN